VGVEADVDLGDAQRGEAPGVGSRKKDAVGFESEAEKERAGMFDDFEDVRAEQDLSAAEAEKKGPGGGQLVQEVLDLGGVHFRGAAVIEIAVHAILVAPPGQVQVNAEGHP